MNSASLIIKTISVILTAGSVIPATRQAMEEYIGTIPTRVVISCFLLLTIFSFLGTSPFGLFSDLISNPEQNNSKLITTESSEEATDKGSIITISGDVLFGTWSVSTNDISSGNINILQDGRFICTMAFSTDDSNGGNWKVINIDDKEAIGVFDAGRNIFAEKN